MLTSLHIENIAVIESADIDFTNGFQVLTGETGAGKSIIIDSISAILGERAYRDIIRTGSVKGVVAAVFHGVPQYSWFDECGVPYDEEELIIQRELYLDGQNKVRVNGRPLSVALLKKLGANLISIHGQHDSQQLFNEETHLPLLDAYGGIVISNSEYSSVYDDLMNVERQIESLQMDESEKTRRTDILSHQISEIDAAAPIIGEDDELMKRRTLLQNSERIVSSAVEIYDALSGNENTDGADSLLYTAEREFSRIAAYYEGLEKAHSELTDIMYRLEDIASEIRDFRDSLDFSQDELDEVEERLTVLKKLKRKYGPEIVDVIAFRDKAAKELEGIESSAEQLERLQKKKEKLLSDVMRIGILLRNQRKDASERIRVQIENELSQLDMPNVRFACEFEEKSPDRDGIDSVRFLMSANVGEEMKPLSKVASGGELARIMLAIKNVMADRDNIPTLIFDEVDAGVSGRAAQRVAEKLKMLSRYKQVLCVTHLPQIAAAADSHYLISKAVRGGRTYTSVDCLDREGRIGEIARIIGGAEITLTTRSSAAEMIDALR